MGTKQQLLTELIELGALKTPSVIAAFETVDRADFVQPDIRPEAYLNDPLPIGFGQTISQPRVVAFMLELLLPKAGDAVLDIGAGSGWQTALIAHIVSRDETGKLLPQSYQGKVIALEVVPELARQAAVNISRYSFLEQGIVEVHCLNGEHGFSKLAPYNRIIAAAAGEYLPTAWVEQLKPGGILVAPIRDSIVRVTKNLDGKLSKESYQGFAFVPFIPDSELLP